MNCRSHILIGRAMPLFVRGVSDLVASYIHPEQIRYMATDMKWAKKYLKPPTHADYIDYCVYHMKDNCGEAIEAMCAQAAALGQMNEGLFRCALFAAKAACGDTKAVTDALNGPVQKKMIGSRLVPHIHTHESVRDALVATTEEGDNVDMIIAILSAVNTMSIAREEFEIADKSAFVTAAKLGRMSAFMFWLKRINACLGARDDVEFDGRIKCEILLREALLAAICGDQEEVVCCVMTQLVGIGHRFYWNHNRVINHRRNYFDLFLREVAAYGKPKYMRLLLEANLTEIFEKTTPIDDRQRDIAGLESNNRSLWKIYNDDYDGDDGDRNVADYIDMPRILRAAEENNNVAMAEYLRDLARKLGVASIVEVAEK